MMSKSHERDIWGNKIKSLPFTLLYLFGNIFSLNKYPPILAYHSIDDSGSEVSVSRVSFRKQMFFLKDRGYRSIPMDQYVTLIRNNDNLPPKTFILTFDDGYHNNFSEAFPVLKELGFTATIYLTTNFMGGFCDWIKDIPVPRLKLLKWEEVLEMDAQGMSFGPHTASHPHLSRLADEEISHEITRSKNIVEDKLCKKVFSFCYPYGDYDGRAKEIVRQCGFTSACAGAYGVRNDLESLYSLNRLAIGPRTTLSYLRFIFSGFYDLNQKRKMIMQ